MDTRTSLTPVPRLAHTIRLALVALTLAFALAPAAAVVADVAPVLAQQGPCGDRPCEEVPTDVSPCGDKPCGEVPAGVSACGDRPCGEVPPGVSACGDRPCAEVPTDVNPCGDKPCGEANPADVNKPADAAPPPPANGDTPATSAPGDQPAENAEEAQPFDAENTGSSSSGWILPVIFVALAALALFWVVRRNRDNAEAEA